MNRISKLIAGAAVLIALAIAERTFERAALAQRSTAPAFQVDPLWPKMPRQWILGQVSGLVERRTLNEVGQFGRIGHHAGEFVFLHNIAVDSKGNLYTSEVGGGRRVQKFLQSAAR